MELECTASIGANTRMPGLCAAFQCASQEKLGFIIDTNGNFNQILIVLGGILEYKYVFFFLKYFLSFLYHENQMYKRNKGMNIIIMIIMHLIRLQ